MTPTTLACSSDPVILDQGVEAILRPERVAHGGAAQARAADRPGPRGDGERALGEDRLMRAVKRAEAEMDDADWGLECRRGRQSRAGCDLPESSTRKTVHQPALGVKLTRCPAH